MLLVLVHLFQLCAEDLIMILYRTFTNYKFSFKLREAIITGRGITQMSEVPKHLLLPVGNAQQESNMQSLSDFAAPDIGFCVVFASNTMEFWWGLVNLITDQELPN